MTAGMWRPTGHCGANVSTCQGNCICGAQVRAELEAERALLDANDHGGTGSQPEAESPAETDCGPLRTIHGLVTRMKLRGNG